MNSQTVSLAATLISVLLPARSAAAFVQRKPGMFTVLSLFALSWAVLLPYYSTPPSQSELLPAFNGFLFVYVGILLRREAEMDQYDPRAPTVEPKDTVALWLLAVMSAPSLLGLTPSSRYVPYVEAWTGVALSALGSWSVVVGLKRLHHGSFVWILPAVVLLGYSLFGIVATWQYPPGTPTPDFFRYIFAVAKVVTTIVFLVLVLDKVVPPEDRRPWWRPAVRFLSIF